MGETAPTAETTNTDDLATAGPVDPAGIRHRPGVRREGAFCVQYVTIHGYRRAYVKAGSGPALLLIHGIGDSSDTWRPVVEQLARALHRHCPGSSRARALREAEGRLLGSGLRQRDARPPERARGRPGDRRRAFARGRRGGTVRLPVSRSLRAPGPGGQRGSGPNGQPLAPRGGGAGRRSPHAAARPATRAVRQPPRRRPVADLRHRTRTRRRGDPRRVRRAAQHGGPHGPSCAPSARASTGRARSSPCWTGPTWPRACPP